MWRDEVDPRNKEKLKRDLEKKIEKERERQQTLRYTPHPAPMDLMQKKQANGKKNC